MKVLITGSRTWDNEATVFEALKDLPEGTEFIIGDARGADEIATSIIVHKYGQDRKWGIKTYKAKWVQYGKAAGPIRNYEMIKEEPDLILAFKKGETPGTNHMIKIAKDYLRSLEACPITRADSSNWYYPHNTKKISSNGLALKIYVSS